MRTMLTRDIAALLPFNVQELNEKSGVCYGINQVSDVYKRQGEAAEENGKTGTDRGRKTF